MRLIISLIILTALTAVMASGRDLDLQATPGALPGQIDEPAAIESLKLSGTIDASDLDFINYSMPSLRRLDISQAGIAEYSGQALANGTTWSAACTIPPYAFIGSGAVEIVIGDDITVIGDGAFAGSSIERIAIPASVKRIGAGAFNDCDRLSALEIPASVTTAGARFAAGCDNLLTVAFGPAEIAAGSFSGCSRLTSFSALAPAVTSIGDRAFAGCEALTGFTFSPQLTAIGDGAFAGAGLKGADLSGCRNLLSLGARAFAGCQSLERVALPDNLASVGEAAFMGDVALSRVNIPSSLTAIPDFAFAGDVSMTGAESVMAGWSRGKVATVGTLSFYRFDKAGELTLPRTLVGLGDNAFEGWSGLKTIFAHELEALPSLGDNVWEGIEPGDVVMYVADDMMDTFKGAQQWSDFNLIPISQSVITDIKPDSPEEVVITAVDGVVSVVARSVISRIAVYSMTGALIAEARPSAESAVVELPTAGRQVVAVVVTMADGSIVSRKIA